MIACLLNQTHFFKHDRKLKVNIDKSIRILKRSSISASKSFMKAILKRLLGSSLGEDEKGVARHFSNYFAPILASDITQLNESFSIRHSVYCEELKFEKENADKSESDEFDIHSIQCLIQHKPSTRYAGTVRVVRPLEKNQTIPIQKYCSNSISPGKINPNDFQPNEICEISRLAIPSEFRRRQTDKFTGAATGVINEQIYSETELRCFPFITIGLYLSAISIVIEAEIPHAFMMMEPRLARSMRLIGIQLEQIGIPLDFHGIRAPYYLDTSASIENLTPGFQLMLSDIRMSLKHDK